MCAFIHTVMRLELWLYFTGQAHRKNLYYYYYYYFYPRHVERAKRAVFKSSAIKVSSYLCSHQDPWRPMVKRAVFTSSAMKVSSYRSVFTSGGRKCRWQFTSSSFVTCGLQYSSSQLNTQADSSAKLATEMEELNEWNSVSMICWNWKQIAETESEKAGSQSSQMHRCTA